MQLPPEPLQTAFCCCTAGGSRARIGIATFDSQVQFYALGAGQSAPQMLVVPDVWEPYAPSASSLIVNAQQSRALVRCEDNHARQQWLLVLVGHFGQPNPRCELFAERSKPWIHCALLCSGDAIAFKPIFSIVMLQLVIGH